MTAIRAENVTVRYGRRTACADVTLSIPKGSVYALIGRNGAGKSSLVRCLLGQLRPDRGRVQLLGEDAWRKRLSREAEFLYRQPILDAAQGGDADAVYYAAPLDLLRFFNSRGAELLMTSAQLRLGPLGRLLPVELQGSTVMAWRIY